MLLSDLIILFSLLLVGFAVWQHHKVSALAYRAALAHTQSQGLTLLDQTIVLKRLRLCRSNHALFAFQRNFNFEFSSIGDERYKGSIVFKGLRLSHIELAPYKTPAQHEPLT